MKELELVVKNVNRAFYEFLSSGTTKVKNRFLRNLASLLTEKENEILKENRKDMEEGEKNGLSKAVLDRILLTPERIGQMGEACLEIADLPDPVGKMESMSSRPMGFSVGKRRTPIGVVAMIYEARPNVTVEAAALCLKAGNAVILRGGSSAYYSNRILLKVLKDALNNSGLNENLIYHPPSQDRRWVDEMLTMDRWVHLVIPRGGEALIRHVKKVSKIPVLKHDRGLCHVYVHDDADLEKSATVIDNSKNQRPSVCNALETLLVNEKVAKEFLPLLDERIGRKTELKGCVKAREVLPHIKPAEEADWDAEYLDYVLSVKIVSSLNEAVDHIRRFSSGHTESIMTKSLTAADEFVRRVDSSSVMVNASTRLADGGVYGLGSEIGISTERLHARGPMGLEELTTYKWVVYGDYTVRE